MLSLITNTILSAALALAAPPQGQIPLGGLEPTKVPVVLGVMSRCPDALLCESVFDRVMQRVSTKVDLSLSFIGKVNVSEPDFGVTCMHGPEECRGNVQFLCAQKYALQDNWWRFVQCQNYQGRYKVGSPNLAKSCATSAKLDWENSGVGECAGMDASGTGEEGVKLLQESVQTSQELGIEKSCTIMISGEAVCVHDGTWKQCENGHAPEDFIRQVNEEYARLNGLWSTEDLEL